MGLRERKKQQTRHRLTETAWRLAADQGFDRVTVAEIARETGVSEATLFNYFRTKEDLFYEPLEAFGDELVQAVRDRPEGTTPSTAVRDFLLQDRGILAVGPDDEDAAQAQLRTQMRVINDSPALLAREQLAFARYTESLAGALRAEDVDPIAAAVVAHALIGVHRSLITFVRAEVLSGTPPRRIAARTRRHCAAAFDLLESGI
ncbi:TetR/AcrR family transcriptional regulator [Promicromonospora panici]|uniref:TetR/AcrR family transcriptional regulator n=1 Tax=Promicromonospora panici TaxID=2219658 RepID=UPI001A92DD7F|nr:TetR/AcrR family transcriptional regulator [Promicromonospora panici]